MKVLKVCIDSSNPKTKKNFSFNFNVDPKNNRNSIASTFKEIMNEYNKFYSIYISTKEFEEENIDSIEDIKKTLECLKGE